MSSNEEYYKYIIKMLDSEDYGFGFRDVNGFLSYLSQKGLKKRYSLDSICYAYAQMKFNARCECMKMNQWVNKTQTEEMKKNLDEFFKQKQPYPDEHMSSKMDIRYGEMKQGKVKPAQKADISTEYLQHLRDEGLSYDKIADAVGMSKSGVAARLKGYKPKNANK